MHGMWCTAEHLRPLSEPFRAAGQEVHAPTLPGHAPQLSQQGGRELATTSLSDYLNFHRRECAARCGGRPPILVGHSMGGLLAQMLAAEIPTAGVVLLCPGAPAGINMIKPPAVIATMHALLKWAFWKRTHLPPRWAAHYGLLARQTAANRPEAYRKLVRESGLAYAQIVFWFLDHKGSSRVESSKLTSPMLILSAQRDRILPPSVVRQVAARYPQAEYQELAEFSHMLFDEPGGEVVATRILEWFISQGWLAKQSSASAARR